MNLGIDFDGVMADTTHLKHREAKRLYGVEGIPSHMFKERPVVEAGYMSREQYRALMNTVCGDREIGLEAQEIDGAQGTLKKLKGEGHRLVIITSREGDEFEVVKDWCGQRDLEMEFISVGYGKDKVEAARGIDVYVDDDVSKLVPLIGVVPHLYLFTQLHNKEMEIPEGITRVEGWDQFEQAVQVIALAQTNS